MLLVDAPAIPPDHWPPGVCSSDKSKSINWSHPYAQKILLHEIFHALGVGHDREGKKGDCKQRRGLMREEVHERASFEASYCAYADHLNCDGPDCGGSQLCGPCPPDPSIDRERPWDPLDLCGLYPNLPECVVGGGGVGGLPFPHCELRSECEVLEVCGEPGDVIPDGGGFSLCVDDPFSVLSWCDLLPLEIGIPPIVERGNDCETHRQNCEYFWTCFSASGGFSTPQQVVATNHAGPKVLLAYPSKGKVVAGTIPVGIAISERDVGGTLLDVFVDHRRVSLVDPFEQTESVGVCNGATGASDPHCPYIGFGGQLDTRQLSDGPHTLQVLAKRDSSSGAFLTWLDVEIEVRNQTQPAEPQIMVAEGWGGHTRIPNDGTYTYSFGERNLFALPLVSPFLVCNQGTADLHLSNLSTMVTGDGFSRQYGGPQTSIRPQRCSQLGVRFEVDDPGVYTGTVRLESNAPENDPFQFAIDGTAVSTVSELPRLGIYLPYPNEVLAGTILVSGWALDDGDLSTSNLAFRLNGASVSLSGLVYGASHTDVCANHADLGSPDCPNVGWSGWLNTTNLPDGAHRLDVLVTDATGQTITETRWFSSEHSPQGTPPRVWMAVPGNNQVISGVVTLSGWALSAGTIDTSDLRFYLDGRPILPGSPFYGIARPGVCNVHADLPSPNCPNVGWRATGDSRLIANGPHTLQLFVQDANGSMTVFTRQFHVQN